MVFSQVGFFEDKFTMCNSSHIAIFCPRRADFEKAALSWRSPRERVGQKSLTNGCATPANLVVCQLQSLLPFALFAPLVCEALFRDVERAVLPLDVAAREVLADHAKHGEL